MHHAHYLFGYGQLTLLLLQRIRREVKVWLSIEHDNVLPLLGTTMGFSRFPAMVCPWAENGTLTSYLKDRHANLSAREILGLVGILGTLF